MALRPELDRADFRIFGVRGERVMLDSDLAEIYGVATKRLNEQLRRNRTRLPTDFAFQLTSEEFGTLRPQFATLKKGRGQHRKYRLFSLSTAQSCLLPYSTARSQLKRACEWCAPS